MVCDERPCRPPDPTHPLHHNVRNRLMEVHWLIVNERSVCAEIGVPGSEAGARGDLLQEGWNGDDTSHDIE